MKQGLVLYKSLFLFIALYFIIVKCDAQDDINALNRIKGYRLRTTNDIQIFINSAENKPVIKDFRKLNSTVFFRRVGAVKEKVDNKTYVLITIPGDNPNSTIVNPESDPRSGKSIHSEDFDGNFWVAEDDIKDDNIKAEFVRYQTDWIGGVLTAPFKSRLKVGEAKSSYIDGSFNAGTFIGGKVSIGSSTPKYLSLVGFFEITTLTFTSANDKAITDLKKTDTGAGFTYGVGAVFRVAGLSPGIIIGWDHAFGDTGSSFVYQDKPWMSLSLNFDFFKPKVSEASTKNQ